MIIPGLDLNSVATKIVDVGYADVLNSIEDADERMQKRNQLFSYYTTGDAASAINKEISNIEDSYDIIQQSCTYLTTAVSVIPTTAAVPQVIVTGTAVGAPNPAWVSLFDNAMKPGLLVSCKFLKFIYNQIIKSCETISFTPTPQITALQVLIQSTETSINALP